MGDSLRYPLHCDCNFQQAAGRTLCHPGLRQALQALRPMTQSPPSPLEPIPPDVPDLHAGPEQWSVAAVAQRSLNGLHQIFSTGPDAMAWPLVVDHLQHLLHVARPHVTADNAIGAVALLTASCLLPDHPWAGFWAIAGSLRLAAWAQQEGGWLDQTLMQLAQSAMRVLGAMPDLLPPCPSAAVKALADITGRSIELQTRGFAMQPTDADLAEMLPGWPDKVFTAFGDRIRRLKDDRWVRMLIEQQAGPDPAELDEICRNVLTLRAHMHVKHNFGDRVDWSAVLDGDIESNVSLNHHAHVAQLASAYAADAHPPYAHHAVRLLRSWFDQSPCPAVWGQLQWRTLEVGGRLTGAWPIIACALIDYEPFVRTSLPDLIRWILASARFLCVYAGPWNNWLQVECAGGLAATALLPEWRDAALAEALFRQRLAWINRHMFLPDGTQAENAPHYHAFPWSRLYIAALVRQALGKPVPDDEWDLLSRGADPLWKLRLPDRTLPPLSDASPHHTCPDSWLALVAAHRNRPEILALVEPGAPSRDLPAPCQNLPDAGYTVLRTGWGPDDDYVLFDHGFFGTNHQHEDKLTFLYASRSRLLIGDAGIYRYQQDAYEHYYRGAWGHNGIVVDDKQQCRTLDHLRGIGEPIPDPDARRNVSPGHYALLSGWYREGFAPRSCGLWQGQADRSADEAVRDRSIQHQRLLLYLWRRGLLVIDRLMGIGSHTMRQIFHLQPFEHRGDEEPTFEPGDLRLAGASAVLSHPAQTGVALVHSARDVEVRTYCGQREPPRGWTALYGQQPSHDVHYVLRTALPTVLAVWIEPVAPGQDHPSTSLQTTVEASLLRFTLRTGQESLSGTIDLDGIVVHWHGTDPNHT